MNYRYFFYAAIAVIAVFIGGILLFGGASDAPNSEILVQISDSPVPESKTSVSQSEIDQKRKEGEAVARARYPDRSDVPGDMESLEKYGLSLLALFQTYDQKLASAVILVSGSGAYRYSVGEYIVDEVYLQAILPDRVLLRHEGGIESLELDALSPKELAPELSAPVATEPLIDNQEQFLTEGQRQRLAFLKHVDLHPVSEGLPAGYIVGDKFPEEASKKTGILPGDVVLSVNGYPVGDEASDILVWGSFQESGKAALIVQREGAQVIIDYPGR
jgi:general secretion pathway protein C